MKDRADKVVAGLGLAESREKAQALIMAGLVFADGQRVEKPGFLLDPGQEIRIKEILPFVSRAGLKLDEALDVFELSVEGQTAADLGASTGGFVDCLLQRGARKVFAVDVDTRQLDVRLREDPRVSLIKKNARYLDRGDFSDIPDIITMDLSFISVLKVLPAVHALLDDGPVLALIKPQFEVGKHQVGKKGIVRDYSLHDEVLNRIADEAWDLGFQSLDVMKPSIRGQKGNQEYALLLKKSGTVPNFSITRLSEKIKEVVLNERD